RVVGLNQLVSQRASLSAGGEWQRQRCDKQGIRLARRRQPTVEDQGLLLVVPKIAEVYRLEGVPRPPDIVGEDHKQAPATRWHPFRKACRLSKYAIIEPNSRSEPKEWHFADQPAVCYLIYITADL